MSYILEAMRRAEADRHRGEVPLLSEPATPVPEPVRTEAAPSRTGLLGSAVIGLAIGFAGYALLEFVLPGAPEGPAGGPVMAPAAPAAPAAGVGAGGALPAQSWGGNGQPAGTGKAPADAVADAKQAARSQGEPPVRGPAPAPAPTARQDVRATTEPAPRGGAGPVADPSGSPTRVAVDQRAPGRAAAPGAASPPVPAAAPVDAPAPSVTTAAPPVAGPTAAAPLPRVRDLPAELQREVPPLLVSGWVQSADPGSRQLLVNGVLLREGDALTPVLRLEMIGRRTAVFSVRGQRFEVPISL